MAKVKLNPIFEEMHGKLGDLVLRRSPIGETNPSNPVNVLRALWEIGMTEQ